MAKKNWKKRKKEKRMLPSADKSYVEKPVSLIDAVGRCDFRHVDPVSLKDAHRMPIIAPVSLMDAHLMPVIAPVSLADSYRYPQLLSRSSHVRTFGPASVSDFRDGSRIVQGFRVPVRSAPTLATWNNRKK